MSQEEKLEGMEEKEEVGGILPEFDRTLTDMSVKVGDSALFSVATNSVPEPEVRWFKESEPIDLSNPRFAVGEEKG